VTRYIGIDALINQPPLDPEYISIADFVARRHTKKSIPRSLIKPLETADALEERCREALELVEEIDTTRNASLMYEVADVRTWAYLGLHLAEKLRGGVALQTYRVTGREGNKKAAVEHLTRALAHWDEVVRITGPIYKDMRLTHYNHNSFDANPNNLFHWALIRDQVAQDVEVARNAKAP
jgi:hypothetical protein